MSVNNKQFPTASHKLISKFKFYRPLVRNNILLCHFFSIFYWAIPRASNWLRPILYCQALPIGFRWM